MTKEERQALYEEAVARGRKANEEDAAKAAAALAAGPAPDPILQWERDMEAEAAAHGGILPPDIPPYFSPNNRLVRLPDVKAPAPSADTEIILNGLIEDCRMLIREVAFHTARLTPDPDIRLRALTTAQTLAVAGATVGKTIAAIRTRKSEQAETRHRMIVEHVPGKGAALNAPDDSEGCGL
jgi:hypothetical protein